MGLAGQQKRRNAMKMRKKFLDYEYEEVLDVRTRELIRVACAIAVGCPD
jgi:alkylhydroperoxidase/carboxymuconolactone decarboxylase family protein YurZ